MPVPKIPGYTCPMIDKLQGAIDRAFRMTDDANSEDAEVLRTLLRDIRHELLGESDKLEVIHDNEMQHLQRPKSTAFTTAPTARSGRENRA